MFKFKLFCLSLLLVFCFSGIIKAEKKSNTEYGKIYYCQSCSAPMTKENEFGTKADGSKTKEYCCDCYTKGKFNLNVPLDKFIESCVKFMTQANTDMTEDQARQFFKEKLPTLKRWKKTAK